MSLGHEYIYKMIYVHVCSLMHINILHKNISHFHCVQYEIVILQVA